MEKLKEIWATKYGKIGIIFFVLVVLAAIGGEKKPSDTNNETVAKTEKEEKVDNSAAEKAKAEEEAKKKAEAERLAKEEAEKKAETERLAKEEAERNNFRMEINSITKTKMKSFNNIYTINYNYSINVLNNTLQIKSKIYDDEDVYQNQTDNIPLSKIADIIVTKYDENSFSGGTQYLNTVSIVEFRAYYESDFGNNKLQYKIYFNDLDKQKELLEFLSNHIKLDDKIQRYSTDNTEKTTIHYDYNFNKKLNLHNKSFICRSKTEMIHMRANFGINEERGKEHFLKGQCDLYEKDNAVGRAYTPMTEENQLNNDEILIKYGTDYYWIVKKDIQ